ncbi:uncharacterized protein C13orf46 homolog [Talpa occidentalis]|uniref:uncharacterized protein C13orf46 homolog n=1 Tax=Talpa occidentalis TaxID=50954 RepID=UPI00188E4879|nr:uncharacterized protein C13orf46 homolog [Talpa occidentalis]
MDKDMGTIHRRHRLGPGAPPLGAAPGNTKAASEVAELQRSRSAGGLLQKGDPPSPVQKLGKELESEEQGKDLGSDAEAAGYQAIPEDGAQEKHQDVLARSDHESRKAEAPEESGPRAREGQHVDVGGQEAKRPAVFVEIDLQDCAEEVVTCAVTEEKRAQADAGDLSEDESGASWVCCVPYATRRKAKESA